MNFDDIQKTWHSPQNRPSAAQLENEKMKFLTDLRRRHCGAVFFMLWILAVLTFLTGKVVFHLLWPDPSMDTIDFTREWSIVPLFALPWLCLFVFFRKYRRHRAQHANYERSISASVRALLDENRLARERQKWAALLSGTMLLLMPLIVYQLRAVGKAGDEILVPAFVILPAFMLCVFLGMIWHHRRTLLPRKRELEALRAAYGEDESGRKAPGPGAG